MKLFNLDSGLMRSLSKFTDCICLSLVYFVSCIPIITIGAASTALYYTVHKVLRHDRGYLFRDYLSSFRSNFRQVTPVWLAAAVIGGVLGADFYISSYYAKAENYFFALTVVVLLGITVWFAWVSYLFPYMARFENTRRQSMKNAILMVIVHLPMTVLMLILAVVNVVIGAALIVNSLDAALFFLQLMGAGLIFSGVTDIATCFYLAKMAKGHFDDLNAVDSTFAEVVDEDGQKD